MPECKSFKPSIDDKSEILILGSMPGIKSLEVQQYYAHPQNRFWRVMGALCKTPNLHALNYQSKIDVLLENNIALWDTIKFCTREGSLDTNISDEEPNDILGLLKQYPRIKTICLNGNKSYLAFKKCFPQLLETYNIYKMPSTSPANAKFRLEDLINEWKIII